MHAQLETIAAELAKQMPEVPPELFADAVREGKAMVDEAIDSWDIDDAIAEYAIEFQRRYPGDQLEPALRLLRTDEGRKLERTVRGATSEMRAFVYMRQNDVGQRQVMRFVRQLVLRIAELKSSQR